MIKYSLILLICSLTSCAGTCKITSDQQPQQESIKKVLDYTINPGRSRAPNYHFQLFSNGTAELEAFSNFSPLGQHKTQLSKEQVISIHKLFSTKKYLQLQDTYKARILGMPERTLSYHSPEGTHKKVKDQFGGPKNLKELEKELEQIIQNLNWQPNK